MTEFITQEVTVDCDIDFEPCYVTSLDAELSRYNEADMVEATVLPESPDFDPDPEMEMTLHLNGTHVFTGDVYTASLEENGAYQIKAFDNAITLKNTTITHSLTAPARVSELVQNVCQTASVPLNLNLSGNGDAAKDKEITREDTKQSASVVLDQLAEAANAVWWVDEYNTVQFGPPESEAVELEYVIEASAGKTTPPYRGVEVIGEGSISEGGLRAANLASLRPTIAKVGIWYNQSNGDWQIIEGQTNSPVFTIKDKQIKSDDHAKAVAMNMIRQLKEQTKGGSVTVVGNPDISKMDVIEMPQEMGNERYYVGTVKHRLDSSEGFTTKINCLGLVPGRYYASGGAGSSVTAN